MQINKLWLSLWGKSFAINKRLTKVAKSTLKVIGYLSIVLSVSNPPKSAYVDYVSNKLINNIQAPATNQCTNLPPQFQQVCQSSIGILSTGINLTQSDKLDRYISGVTEYNNYVLFSIYKLKAEGIPAGETLGILGQFIPIKGK